MKLGKQILIPAIKSVVKNVDLENKKVEIQLDIGKNIANLYEVKNDFTCIKIDGILIAILNEEKSKTYIQKLKQDEEKTKNELKQLMITEIDSKEKAIGIMLLEKEAGKTKKTFK